MSALNGIVGLIPYASMPKECPSSKYTKIKLHTIADRTVEDSPLLKRFPDWAGMYHGAHRREYVMVDFLRTSNILKQVDKK
jgi:hypothetical protein